MAVDYEKVIKEIIHAFQGSVNSVSELMNFDRDVQQFVTATLAELQGRLNQDNPRRNVEKAIAVIKNMRGNDSLRSRYEKMLNQCAVLLVSYFGASLCEIFKCSVADRMCSPTFNEYFKEKEIKVSLADVWEAGCNVAEFVGEVIVRKNDISFQDMHSVSRVFRDYFGVSIRRDGGVNDIVACHACRHAIVHSGGIVDVKLIRQIKDAVPRSIKPVMSEGDEIQFTEDEIRVICTSMQAYLCNLAEALLM